MAAKSPYHDGSSSNSHTREISPFFFLPNEDGSNPHQEEYDPEQQHQYPPITLSCANCERIVGDSSAFLFATRQMGTITLERAVSVEVGLGGLKTSLEGEWDEFCNYKDITCGKCNVALGKVYFATTSKLSALQNKHTLYLIALSFYHHASNAPSLPIAATSEIYAQLHPSPEALVEDIGRIQTFCVVLRDEQVNFIRELKKLGAATGVDVELEDAGTSGEELDARDSLKEKVQLLDGLLEKVKSLEKMIEETRRSGNEEEKKKKKKEENVHKVQQHLEAREETAPEKSKDKEKPPTTAPEPPKKPQPDDSKVVSDLVFTTLRRQDRKPQRLPPPPPPPTTVSKRKRRSAGGEGTITIADRPLDTPTATATTSEDDIAVCIPQRKPKKEVPNSQSTEEEGYEEGLSSSARKGGREYVVEVDEEEEEREEERIKSPAEKRRKSVPVSKREALGRRVLQSRKGHR